MLKSLNSIATNLMLSEKNYCSQYWNDISNRSKCYSGNVRKYDLKKAKAKRKLQRKARKINRK